MTHREYMTRTGEIIRRTVSGKDAGKQEVSTAAFESDALIQAKTELSRLIGANGFYLWACTLPAATIMNEGKYIDAIQEKTGRVMAAPHISTPAKIALATLKLTNRILDEISEQELEDLLDNREVEPHWSDDPKLWSVSERAR